MSDERKKKNLGLPGASRRERKVLRKYFGRGAYGRSSGGLGREIWSLVGLVSLIVIIIFVARGGINQLAFWNTMKKWSTNIGHNVEQHIDPNEVEVGSDGIYYDRKKDK